MPLSIIRSSEVNVACTDLILLIGSEQDIEDDYTYDTSKIEAFLLPKGTVAEVYATTLHYAPCSVDGNNFRCVVVLPKDTNLDLEVKPEGAKEDPLLVARNKWLIAHEDAKIEGAFNGLNGREYQCRVNKRLADNKPVRNITKAFLFSPVFVFSFIKCYSTVTLFAKLRGWSTLRPFSTDT